MKLRRIIPEVIFGIPLTILALTSVAPFIFMLLTSFTDKMYLNLAFSNVNFGINSYFNIVKNFNMSRIFLNSAIITVSTCILDCLISSMASFAFAKKRFPGRDKLFFVYIATLMIPAQVTIIPYFIIVRKLALINTHLALIIPIGAFGVFLIRQFMLNLPNELLEAGIIDGCNEPQLFIIIVIPLIRAALVSLMVFAFFASWNDFLRPLLVMTKNDMQTLTVALATLSGTHIPNMGLLMAGAAIGFLPPIMLYAFLQKQFVEGIALSGIKG